MQRTEKKTVKIIAHQYADLHILPDPSRPLEELGDYKTFTFDIFMLCALSFK